MRSIDVIASHPQSEEGRTVKIRLRYEEVERKKKTLRLTGNIIIFYDNITNHGDHENSCLHRVSKKHC